MANLFAQKNTAVGKTQSPTPLKAEPKTAHGVIHKKAIHVPSGSMAAASKLLHGGNVKNAKKG